MCPSVVIGDNAAYPQLNYRYVACDAFSPVVVLERGKSPSDKTNPTSNYVNQYDYSLSLPPTKGAASTDGPNSIGNALSAMSRGAAVYSVVYGSPSAINKYDLASGKVTKVGVFTGTAAGLTDMAVLTNEAGTDDAYLLFGSQLVAGVLYVSLNMTDANAPHTLSDTSVSVVNTGLLAAGLTLSNNHFGTASGDLYFSTTQGLQFVSNADLRAALAAGSTVAPTQLTISGASIGVLNSIRFDKLNNLLGITWQGDITQINAIDGAANMPNVLANTTTTVNQTCGPLPMVAAIPTGPVRADVTFTFSVSGDCNDVAANQTSVLQQLTDDLTSALAIDRLQIYLVPTAPLPCSAGVYIVTGVFPSIDTGSAVDPVTLSSQLSAKISSGSDAALYSSDRSRSKFIVAGSYSVTSTGGGSSPPPSNGGGGTIVVATSSGGNGAGGGAGSTSSSSSSGANSHNGPNNSTGSSGLGRSSSTGAFESESTAPKCESATFDCAAAGLHSNSLTALIALLAAALLNKL